MEGQGNFRPNYNYTFNSYNRMNVSDIGLPSDNNQAMFPTDNHHYLGNPVFPSSMDIVGTHFAVNRQHSDYFGMNFTPGNFYDQINTPVDQSIKTDKEPDSGHIMGSIHNPFMQDRSSATSAFRINDITKSAIYKKSFDGHFSETITKEEADAEEDISITKDNNKEVDNKEMENVVEETEQTKKCNKDNSFELRNADNTSETNVLISAIKEETITDDENDVNIEDGDDTSDVSDASTIIEDEDEIVDKLKKKKNNLVVKLQDENTRKKPRKQKMPKPVLPKDKKEFTCETCAKVVLSLRALIKHRNLHTENFKCKECNKIFNSEESLKNHDKVHSGFIGNEVCNVCDKKFYDRSSLNKHTLSVHMGIKNFQCEYCNLSFFARKTYEEHVRVHTGERPFKCELCPKAYKRISDLNHHVRLHKGEVSHTCEKCGEGFRRVSELNRHISTKHGSDRPDITPIYKSKSCSWCGLAFSTSKALSQHFNTHMENINATQIGGQNAVAFQHDKMKLVEEMVQEIGTNLTGPGISEVIDGNSFLPNGPNIAECWNIQTQPRAAMSQGLDMTYKSMVKTEPAKNTDYMYDRNNLTGSKIDVFKLDNKTSNVVKSKGLVKDINNPQITVCEQSVVEATSEMKEGEECYELVSTERKQSDNVENQNDFMKSEVNDFFDYDDENDDYEGDTDVEDYNYVISDTDVIDKKDIQEKLGEIIQVKKEADEDNISDVDEKYNSEADVSKDPDFVPASEKISKRKATKPRKKIPQKKKIKKETDAMDKIETSGNEKKNEKQKSKKQKLEEEDGSMDLIALKCLQCGKYFSKKKSLVLHMNLHRGTHSCEICGKCFATKKSLKTHIDNHEGRKVNTATCNVCDKVFYDASSMNKHVKTVHMDYKPFPCTECDRRFSEHKTLSEHLRVHTGERPFACEVCGKTYKRSSELNFHIRKHSGEVNLNCPECGKGFIRMGQLRQHMLLRHDKERPFRCFLCAKTFPTHPMLKDHQKMHSIQRKHVCEKCGYKFHTKSKLQKHLRRKTDCQNDCGLNANGMFVCKYCYSEFSTVEERYAHLEDVHKNDKRRTYPCDVCGKEFRRSQALKIHLKIHYQVRDYKCTMCSAAFIQRHHLTQHIATHTGSRPYQCNVCLKNFAHSATLYNHMKHH